MNWEEGEEVVLAKIIGIRRPLSGPENHCFQTPASGRLFSWDERSGKSPSVSSRWPKMPGSCATIPWLPTPAPLIGRLGLLPPFLYSKQSPTPSQPSQLLVLNVLPPSALSFLQQNVFAGKTGASATLQEVAPDLALSHQLQSVHTLAPLSARAPREGPSAFLGNVEDLIYNYSKELQRELKRKGTLLVSVSRKLSPKDTKVALPPWTPFHWAPARSLRSPRPPAN